MSDRINNRTLLLLNLAQIWRFRYEIRTDRFTQFQLPSGWKGPIMLETPERLRNSVSSALAALV